MANGVSVSDPTRVGYTFAGWKITATLSQVNKAYIEMNAGYQFYDSGYPNAVIYEPFYVKTGTTYTVPLGNGEVRWRNYNATTGAYLGNISSSTSFAGNNSNIAIWYHKGNSTSGATTTTITFNSGTTFETSTYSVTGNLNLTAQWTANKYFVKFEKNPPSSTTSVSGTMANQEFTYDQAKALTTNVYTAVDYNFKYWSTKKDGTGKLYINSHTIENLTTTNNATITLYAQWEKIIYTINFECYGEYSFNDIYIILNGKKYYGINYSITYIPGTEIKWYYNDMDGMKSTTQEQSSVDGITTKITTTSTQGVQVSIGDVEDEPTYNTGSSAISKSGAITLSRDDNGKVIKVCHVRRITTKMTPGGISTTVDNGTIPTKEGLTEEPLVYKWELNWADDQEYGNQTVYVKADNTSKLYSNQSCTTEATIKTSFGSYTFKGYYTGKSGKGDQYITSSGKRTSSSATGEVTLYAYLIPRELSVSVYLTDVGHSNSRVYSSASDTKTGYYLYYLVAFTGNRISDFYIFILSEKSTQDLTTTEASYHYSCIYNISQQITIKDSTSSTTLNETFYDGWAMGIVEITIEYATSTASLSNLELDGHMSAYSDNAVAVVLDGESNSVSETAQVWLDDKFRKLQQKQDVVVDFDGVSFDT